MQVILKYKAKLSQQEKVIDNLQLKLCKELDKNEDKQEKSSDESLTKLTKIPYSQALKQPLQKPKFDPNIKCDVIYVSTNLPKEKASTQVMFLNSVDQNAKHKMTKSELDAVKNQVKKALNVKEESIRINGVGATSNGGLVMSFATKEQAEKAKEVLSKKKDEIKFEPIIPNKLQPKITIVRIDETIMDIDLVETIKAQNYEIAQPLEDGETMKVMFSSQYKNCEGKKNTVFRCSPKLGALIIKQKPLYIGWNKCNCYDRFYFKVYYHCNGFNHYAKHCPQKEHPPTSLCCAKNHKSMDCPTKQDKSTHQCCNCLKSSYSVYQSQVHTHNASSYLRPLIEKQKQLRIKNTDFGDDGFNV